MLDQFARNEGDLPQSIAARYAASVRRHLAIVDQSRLRCDCLKLALAHQPRRWRVTDMSTASDLARLIQRGEEFDVILLGGSTCANVDLVDIGDFPVQAGLGNAQEFSKAGHYRSTLEMLEPPPNPPAA